MSRGQHRHGPINEPIAPAEAEEPAQASSFAALVEELPEPAAEPEVEPTISELVADAIRAANLSGRFGDAGALNAVAVTLGELRRALAGAKGLARDDLRAAFDHLDALI